MIINVSFTVVVHGLGGEFGYMTTIEPAEKLNNWCNSLLQGIWFAMSLKNLVRLTGTATRCTKEAATGNAHHQEAVSG